MSGARIESVERLLERAEGHREGPSGSPSFDERRALYEAHRVPEGRRHQEAERILRFWPEETLALAKHVGADWHALLEPARWAGVGDLTLKEALDFALDLIRRKGRWPRTDEWRVRFGKTTGHKGPGDVPGQGALL